MPKIVRLALPLLLVVLAACHGDDSGQASCSQASLVGTWIQSCEAKNAAFQTISVTFSSSNTFTIAETGYSDAGCSTTNGVNANATGSVNIGDCGSVGGTNDIDFIPDTGSDVGCGSGTTSYSIYQITGSTLITGEGGNNGGGNTDCSASNRSSVLDSQHTFTKQ